jgi:hypothetical protein
MRRGRNLRPDFHEVNIVWFPLIPLAGMAFTLCLVPTIILLKQGHERKQWRHLERLRAIDAGAPVPPANTTPGTGAVIAIGAGVPFFAIFGALATTMSTHEYMPHALERSAVAWGCAVVVSLGALTTSLILGVLQHRAHARAVDQLADARFDSSKSAYDPDAFDVVGRRG